MEMQSAILRLYKTLQAVPQINCQEKQWRIQICDLRVLEDMWTSFKYEPHYSLDSLRKHQWQWHSCYSGACSERSWQLCGGFGSCVQGQGHEPGLGHKGKAKAKEWFWATMQDCLPKEWRSRPCRLAMISPCPSRSLKSLTFSRGGPSRMKFCVLSSCESRPVPASRLGSRYLLPSETNSHVSLSSCCHGQGQHPGWALHHLSARGHWGEQDRRSPSGPLQGDWSPWLWRISWLPETLASSQSPCPRNCCLRPVSMNATCWPGATLPPRAISPQPPLMRSLRPSAILPPNPPLERDHINRASYQEFTDQLLKTHTKVLVQRTWAPTVATMWCFYTRKIKRINLKNNKGQKKRHQANLKDVFRTLIYYG